MLCRGSDGSADCASDGSESQYSEPVFAAHPGKNLGAFRRTTSRLFGVVEVDESLFGARRVKGKRGRGAYGKTTVFGLYERNGQVYTEIDPIAQNTRCKVLSRQGGKRYQFRWLEGLQRPRRYRLRPLPCRSQQGRVRPRTHPVNGIEGFWGLAKVRLAKFRGMHSQTFILHLKETEFRYNNRNHDIGRLILKACRNKPLN